MHIETRTGRAAVWTASVGVSIVGVIAAGVSLAWLVGSFGYLVLVMPRSPRDPWDDGSRI